jgi:uncharacterized oxidoreductase
VASGHVFSAPALTRAITAVLRAAGSAEHEASMVAESLVEANLRGHDSHGVGMIPRYVDTTLLGGLRVNQHVRVTLDAGSLVAFDGNRGHGAVLGEEAMRAAIPRARELGSCVMLLADAHHLGRIGQYAEMATAAGLVSLHFVNVLSNPIVAPWGGRDARFGTNPCCIGVPLPGEPPFILDFATSAVAQGKLRVAHNKGEAVKDGLLIDDQGHATTDPRYAVVPPWGAIMPFGEHKGYGLAVACELLAGALCGGGTEDGVPRTDKRVVNGMLTILIDPARAGNAEGFAQRTRGFLDWLRKSRAAQGFDRVRIAGEPERECRAQRVANGIVVDAATWRAIGDAAEKVEVSRATVDALAAGAA